jgi:transposase
VLEEDQHTEEIIARVAALDIGKAELVCCVRVPDEDRPGRRLQEVASYSTMTRGLLRLADRLTGLGVTRVVMEATSDYWKPIYYLLEAHGFETWLVNARDVKHLPGRPKNDKLDAVWLGKVAERQMIRPSFVPPPQIRQLRDVTRYRCDLVEVRTAEKQRVEKLLEDAPLTELPGRRFVSAAPLAWCAAMVRSRGWNSGYAAGSGVLGRATVWVARGDRRGVRALPAA